MPNNYHNDAFFGETMSFREVFQKDDYFISPNFASEDRISARMMPKRPRTEPKISMTKT